MSIDLLDIFQLSCGDRHILIVTFQYLFQTSYHLYKLCIKLTVYNITLL